MEKMYNWEYIYRGDIYRMEKGKGVLEEKNKNNNLTATYTYGHELISQNRATSVSFYNRDGLGYNIINKCKSNSNRYL